MNYISEKTTVHFLDMYTGFVYFVQLIVLVFDRPDQLSNLVPDHL